MVQSLWWHYEYTGDEEFLAERAFEPIKEAVTFLTEYITRPAVDRWFDDDSNHVFPTVPRSYTASRPTSRRITTVCPI
jgi:hypothetical protein